MPAVIGSIKKSMSFTKTQLTSEALCSDFIFEKFNMLSHFFHPKHYFLTVTLTLSNSQSLQLSLPFDRPGSVIVARLHTICKRCVVRFPPGSKKKNMVVGSCKAFRLVFWSGSSTLNQCTFRKGPFRFCFYFIYFLLVPWFHFREIKRGLAIFFHQKHNFLTLNEIKGPSNPASYMILAFGHVT